MINPQQILKKYWGYNTFRPLQLEIINSVLSGKDTLALLPTGGGKSICYQVPGLCYESGICLVVSPLIALMKDQVQNLRNKGINADALYSGQHYREMERILDNAQNNYLKFLYVSPERLKTDLFKIRLLQMKVNLVAIDEAHCVSQWGYDFRPAYLEIKEMKKVLDNVPFIALTATATNRVKEDIVEKLELDQVNKFQKSFKRENLSYSVLYEENKLEKLIEIFDKVKGTGLVYVRSRKKTIEIAKHLNKHGIITDIYHAGLSPSVRDKKQENWMKGKTRVIVCTNAFGMGIDKPDVRIVVHIALPDSLEAYFQEAGRAGRDGNKAYATLLFQKKDSRRLALNLRNAFPVESELKRVYNSLGNHFNLAIGSGKGHSFPFFITEHARNYNFKPIHLFNALNILQNEELIHLSDSYYEPSKIKIIQSREALYEFQVKNQQFNKLIKTMLRTLEGIMTDFVIIREKLLASQVQVNVTDLKAQLNLLHKNKLINYLPQHDQPMLTFITERLAPDNIGFNNSRLEFRKKIQTENVNAIINYAEEKHICRSQQLLAYFGEETDQKCGFCDVCLGRNEKKYEEISSNLENEIKELLSEGGMSIDLIVNSLKKYPKDRLTETIRLLIDRNVLTIDNNRIIQYI